MFAGVEFPPLENRRSQAHLATATRPRTQIRAQRRAARMTTKSESTCSLSSAAMDVEDEEVVVFKLLRILMVNFLLEREERTEKLGFWSVWMRLEKASQQEVKRNINEQVRFVYITTLVLVE